MMSLIRSTQVMVIVSTLAIATPACSEKKRASAADGDQSAKPPVNTQEHYRWAVDTSEGNLRIARLEDFWKLNRPSNKSAESDKPHYEDQAHHQATVKCAWDLARAYINTENSERALVFLDWLESNDSKVGEQLSAD